MAFTGMVLAGAGSASGQVISNVAAINVTNTVAVITWTTNIPASSLVNYGVTDSHGTSSGLNPALVTAHSVPLIGLSANTLYNFNVASNASSGSTATSANFRFATLSTSPIIGDINVIYLTSTSATINWTTDQPSTGMVNYGTTTSYNTATPLVSTPTTAHSLNLSGLSPATTYNFTVVSAVGSNGVPSTSANQTFTTASPNATSPDVSFVASWGMTNSGAIFSWSTDLPANTALAYGTTTALGQLTPLQAALSASHGVTLTGLDPGTTYYFVAISTGSDGATGYSPLGSFTTTGLPPVAPLISKVASANLTTTSATITWTTDVPGNSLVNYGTTTNYGLSALDPTLSKTHSVTLTRLASGTSYVFQVVSANPAGVSTFGADLSGFTIWAWGDSQTLGGADGSRINYPASLSTDLGGVTVNNQGVGGQTSTQIAQRMLAMPATFAPGNCHVIWSGSNNPTEVSQIQSDIASMVDALASPKCFLILGDVNQVVSPIGSYIYSSIIATNQGLASTFGNNYLNIRELVVQAYNPALPLDVADHAMDIPPSSLRAVVAIGTITSGALDSQSCTFNLSGGTQGPGTVIILDSETILINAINNNASVTDCVRGYNGTAAASHASNATYSKIDGTHLGANGLQFVASQVASWFESQAWPLCGGTSICPSPARFTTPVADMTNPLISAITASNITSTSAIISWTTDQPSSSLVNYGTTTAYGTSSTLGPTLSTKHAVSLAGLATNTVYDFDVVSANSAGKASTSTNSTFTTNAGTTTALIISSLAATNLTPTSAAITWTTSQPATAQVKYGATSNYGSQSSATTTVATTQSVALIGLSPNTTYNYQAISTTPSGGSALSANFLFTTPGTSATPPYVGYVAFWGVNNNGVTISWSTDVNANTVVAYGTSPALGQIYTNTSTGLTISHGAVLTGLIPGTKYYFVAQSTGANGSTGSSTSYSFTTTGTAPTNASFTLSSTTASATVGSTGTATISVVPANGFSSGVTLAASDWPSGITGTFGTNPATASSNVTISVGATVAAGPYTLTVNGTSGSLIQPTTISLIVVPASSSGSSAIFTSLDTSTQGTWSGKYGSDGFLIANGSSNLPAYANVSFNGALTYTWASLTSDVRALQSYQGTSPRIASSYYSNNGSFTISLGLTDGAIHQVALYLLDWDTSSRAQTITITDPITGTVLDTRSAAALHNGTYGIWNIKGTVAIKVSEASGNPVASALFFAPASGTPASPGFALNGSAVTANAGSSGTSKVAVTPANGFNSPVTLTASGWPSGITGTFGTNPSTGSSIVTINVGVGVTPGPYSLTVTGVGGTLSAATTIALTVTPPGLGSSATFAGLDITTQGAWTGRYGSSGYLIANSASVNPSVATVAVPNALTYTWAGQTTDTRALQIYPGSSIGIASSYTQYAGQTLTINLQIANSNTQKVSLYLLDWDSSSRNETITILDALTNTVLDTQTFSAFHNGQYASWNVKGTVTIKVSPNANISTAVSGIFFN